MDFEESPVGEGGETPLQDEPEYDYNIVEKDNQAMSDDENNDEQVQREEQDMEEDAPDNDNDGPADRHDDMASLGSPTQDPGSPVYSDEPQSPGPGSPVQQEGSTQGSPMNYDSPPGSPTQPESPREDIESPLGSPVQPKSPGDNNQSPYGSPTQPHSPRESNENPESPGVSQDAEDGQGPQSPDENTQSSSIDEQNREVGSPTADSNPQSPEVHRSRSVSPAGSAQSKSGSPVRSQSGSPARSQPGSPIARSRSGSPEENARSRSGSPAGSQRSRSGSPAGSNKSRSRSGSPAGSVRSRSGTPARSQSGSPSRSRSGSPAGSARSRSGSPAGSAKSRSKSGSPAGSQRSKSGSPARSRSGSPAGSARSRSRSGSAAGSVRSRSVSPGRSRSGSPARSRSGSPARSRSGSPARRRSRSRSGSPARSRSGSRASGRSRSGSPARSRSRSSSPAATPPYSPLGSKASGSPPQSPVGSDTEKNKDESDREDLVADIFGSSDEEEEFEGFEKADMEATAKKKEKKEKKTAILSDDEEGGVTGEVENNTQILPDMSDDENDKAAWQDGQEKDMVSDFDLMMAKKKEEMSKRRKKRKEYDLINDSDDLIADMINKMKVAAEEDRGLNMDKKPAIKKLQYLPTVVSQLKKADLHNAFLDCGILSAMTEWLAPLPDKSLPNLQIRQAFLKTLSEFPSINPGALKTSGIGKAVMYLYKHPKEVKENRERAGKLINEWSRPLFNLTSNYKSLSKEEREQRDYDQIPKRRRTSMEEGGMTPRKDLDKSLSGEQKALRPGDPGWVYRARVPMPSNKDYVIRPKWKTEQEGVEPKRGPSKKQPTRYEKQVRKFAEKKKNSKAIRAVQISIEGRNMAI